MNLYPAIKFRMGDWDYYVVKMTTREISKDVKFAYEAHEDRTLDEAIQRALNETRSKKEIVSYLKRQPARFFSSIVIAALDGTPMFYPIHISDDEQFQIFADDERLNDTFGVLKFDGTQTYYALDGQHRLAAIQATLDRDDPSYDGRPEAFAEDELSVIIVVPSSEEGKESFMQRYRRLFSNLNRYAKAMDPATNIVMDEDDVFAILTRRLISGHDFFRWEGRHKDSPRIKAEGGKNLRKTDPYFTSIITLYEMNEQLLTSKRREDSDGGWGLDAEDVKSFKRFRPSEELIDSLYEELVLYWDGLLQALPALRSNPTTMREHDPADDAELNDSLIFWPIGQNLLAQVARDLLDRRLPDPQKPTSADVVTALEPLSELNWELHDAPWRYFLLVSDKKRWKMRSSERPETNRIARRLIRWATGLDELPQDELDALQVDWSSYLSPAQTPESENELWEEFTSAFLNGK